MTDMPHTATLDGSKWLFRECEACHDTGNKRFETTASNGTPHVVFAQIDCRICQGRVLSRITFNQPQRGCRARKDNMKNEDLELLEARLAEVKMTRDEWCEHYVRARDALRAIYAIAEKERLHDIAALVLGALGKDGVKQ
jgi:hypothetical protein